MPLFIFSCKSSKKKIFWPIAGCAYQGYLALIRIYAHHWSIRTASARSFQPLNFLFRRVSPATEIIAFNPSFWCLLWPDAQAPTKNHKNAADERSIGHGLDRRRGKKGTSGAPGCRIEALDSPGWQ